jgi:hypothetical protein
MLRPLPRSVSPSRTRLARAALVLAAATGGCTSVVRLKPAEVVKFSGAREQHTTVMSYGWGYGYGWGPHRGMMLGGPNYGVASVVPVAHVETVDGRIEAIPATSPFEVVFIDGSARRFTPPVEARIEGGSLVVASSEHPREAYELAAIRYVEVQKVEQGRTTALVLGISFGVVGATLLAPLAFR